MGRNAKREGRELYAWRALGSATIRIRLAEQRSIQICALESPNVALRARELVALDFALANPLEQRPRLHLQPFPLFSFVCST